MKTVVLDGYALNPGDLSWEWLKAFGESSVYERTEPAGILERAAGAEILLTNKTPLGAATLKALPELKYVCVLATGYNVVDVAAAKELGIKVSNVPEYGTGAVAQMAFALILELARNAGGHAKSVREGRWSSSKDFCYWDTPQVDLEGLTLGILGLGRIGLAVARIGLAFGMNVVAAGSGKAKEPVAGIEYVSVDELFRRSDVLSLHCPLTPQTDGIVNATRLATMKPGAFLINTSRGGLVNEKELAEALERGVIAGAGLDVLSSEPPKPENPLLKSKNCLVTPHIAWASSTARARLMKIAEENVRSYVLGKPRNIVNA